MPFVQGLLTGEQTGQPILTDLHLTGSKLVTIGSLIVVLKQGWFFNTAQAESVTDNLGNSYSLGAYFEGGSPTGSQHEQQISYAIANATGTLTDITIHSSGIGSIAFHETGCSAEFTEVDPPSFTNWSAEYATAASISSAAVTLPYGLLLYGAGVGGGPIPGSDQVGGGTNFVPPSGFAVASSHFTSGYASSSFLCYKYGTLASEVLTSSWDEAGKKASACHGVGVALTPGTTQIYRRITR